MPRHNHGHNHGHHHGNGFTTGFILGSPCYHDRYYHDNMDYDPYRHTYRNYSSERQRTAQLQEKNARLQQQLREAEAREQARLIAEQHQAFLAATASQGGSFDVNQLNNIPALPILATAPVLPSTTITLPYWALLHDDVNLFSLAINSKGYRLNMPEYPDNNPLHLIRTKENAVSFLAAVRQKITPNDANFLIESILTRIKNDPSKTIYIYEIGIFQWLLDNNLVENKYSDSFNDIAMSIGYHNFAFVNAVFSKKNFGTFYKNNDSLRRKMLTNVTNNLDPNTLLNWYTNSKGLFLAKTMYEDFLTLSSVVYSNRLILDVMTTAANGKLDFEMLDSRNISELIDKYSTDFNPILHHLARKQPTLLLALPYEKKPMIAKVLQRVYMDTFRTMTDAINVVSSSKQRQKKITEREKELLPLVRAAFNNQMNAADVKDFALQLEAQWIEDKQFSPKSIEVMLKLAKTEILSRLKTNSYETPTPDIAHFMAKNRTTHHFFCLPFQLTMFSTTSTKTYNLYTEHKKFYEAVDRDIASGKREFTALTGIR